ncbi:hypothetical protein LPJ53_002421 [Coemansia erecta]|uniref:Phosphoglycerate mutase-like protein n=1 Tax=Coemansia erecta TaxID=147472 RepID=A0A9W7XY69_9FUNG|nr:hypothetical protein LPJ53_002421 [Coemansia erecta]
MPLLNIYIARHGETDANAQRIVQGSRMNLPLNDRGRLQSEALRREMLAKNIDWIVTSPLIRAVQTSEIVQPHAAIPNTVDPRLTETSLGIADGLPVAIGRPLFLPVLAQWDMGNFDARVPGGDSLSECSERVSAAFENILWEAVRKGYPNILLCVHGGTMCAIMAALVARDLCKLNMYPHANCAYHHVTVEVPEYTSDTDIDIEKLEFVPVAICVKSHLEDAGLAEHQL